MISTSTGEAVAYAICNLEDRGPMMIDPQTKVYPGMIVGEHTRDNDLEVNVIKGKQLTNVRTSSKDEAVRLTPPIRMSLEKALAYIGEDELVEVTPKSIRLRKAISTPTSASAWKGPLPPRWQAELANRTLGALPFRHAYVECGVRLTWVEASG